MKFINKHLFRGFFFLAALLCLFFVDLQIYKNTDSALILFPYLLSLIFIAYFFLHTYGKKQKEKSKHNIQSYPIMDFTILTILCLIHIASLIYFGNFKTHFIQDEFITAYTSYHLPSFQVINWFQGFPEKDQWISQFPILFFILQKPFLVLLGPSIETIRISTWPYHILTIVYLYLLTKHIFNKSSIAAISVLFYIFFAPTAYLESLGVHFISSTSFFLIAFYYLLLTIKTKKEIFSLLFGLFTALCYLTYASSYIALPIFIFVICVETIIKKSFRFYLHLVPGILFFLFILSPFITYAVFKTNYFFQRINEVSNTSSYFDMLLHPFVRHNLEFFYQQRIIPNISAMYQNGLGGVNDYWFGHRAPFTQISLYFLLVGVAISLIRIIQGKIIYFYPILITALSFLFGMAMTNPPGALHRFSIAFPFISIILTIPFTWLLNLKLKDKTAIINYLLVLSLVSLFLIANTNLAITMVNDDTKLSQLTDSIYLTSFISAHIKKNTQIYIAAFPTYHLERELFFRLHNQYVIQTNYFSSLPYDSKHDPIIVQGPDMSVAAQLEQQYPSVYMLDTVDGYKLKHHLLFIPQ